MFLYVTTASVNYVNNMNVRKDIHQKCTCVHAGSFIKFNSH